MFSPFRRIPKRSRIPALAGILFLQTVPVFSQQVTMGSLSFSLATNGGQVTGLKDFKWGQTPLASSGQEFPLTLLVQDGGSSPTSYTNFTLIQAASGSSQAVVRLAPVGLPGVEVKCVFSPLAQQNVAGHSFVGFRYRYEVISSLPGCEIVERTRWCLGGNGTSGTYFIRNVYGAQEYQLGTPPALNTFTTGDVPHSRFGKMQAYDYHYIPAKGFMLVHFDQPALILNGKKSYTLGGIPQDSDHYFLAPPAMASPWKHVLLHESAQNLTSQQQLQDFAAVGDWVENYYRQLKGYLKGDSKPFLWVSPRFSRVKSMLPDIQKLGFKRIWVGPIWKSAATEAPSTGLSSMSTYELDVASKWGGLAGLADLCQEAHRYGIEVIAWLPFVHVSYLSPLLTANPGWEAYPIRDDLYGDQLVPLDLSQSAVRDYVLTKLQIVRNAGLDGVWLDSYHNFGIEVYHASNGARVPQVNATLDLQKEIQAMGFTVLIEGMSPYGITSSGMTVDRLSTYFNGAEWRALPSNAYLIKSKLNANGNSIGSDLSGVPYFDFLVWRSPLAIETLVGDANTLWANFTDEELRMLRHNHHIYNTAYRSMRMTPEVLPSGQGVCWSPAADWSLFAFQNVTVPTTSGQPILDLETFSYFTAGASLAAQGGRAYLKVPAMPVFHDSFESGGPQNPQGAGAWWSMSSGVTVQDAVALDRGYSAAVLDEDSGSGQSMVAAFDTTTGAGDYGLTFKAAVEHVGTNDNNNSLVLRNGTGDVRGQIRWRQGSLQYGPSWISFGSYSSGHELEYKCILSESAGTYSVYASNGASVTNVPMQGTAVSGVNRIAFNSGVVNASQVKWYLDNVTFTPARLLLADSFESGSLSGPQGPSAVWSGTSGVTVQSSNVISGGSSVRIYDSHGSISQSLVGVFERTSGSDLYRLSFDAKVSPVASSSNNNCLVLRNGLGDVRVQLRWQDGSLQHGSSWSAFGTYAAGATLHYAITVDERTASYSITVSNGSAVYSAPVEGRRFDGVDRAAFNSGLISASQVEWIVDNVKLQQF